MDGAATLERTLLIVKPDGVTRGHVGEILHRVEAKGYRIAALALRVADRGTLAEHYADHVDKPFYPGRAGPPDLRPRRRVQGVVVVLRQAAGPGRTLFTTADGIESLWDRSTALITDPPPVRPYAAGTWGPNAIHQLIAPHAWRLPFERVWREKRPD